MLCCPAAFLLLGSSQPLCFTAGLLLMGAAHGVLTVKGAHLASHGSLSGSQAGADFWASFFLEVRWAAHTDYWRQCRCSKIYVGFDICVCKMVDFLLQDWYISSICTSYTFTEFIKTNTGLPWYHPIAT